MDKLASAIDESRARVSQDLILYRTERPVKAARRRRIAVIIDGQVTLSVASARGSQGGRALGAKQVVIATPVGTAGPADRITARRYDFVCPSIVMVPQGHPAPYDLSHLAVDDHRDPAGEPLHRALQCGTGSGPGSRGRATHRSRSPACPIRAPLGWKSGSISDGPTRRWRRSGQVRPQL